MRSAHCPYQYSKEPIQSIQSIMCARYPTSDAKPSTCKTLPAKPLSKHVAIQSLAIQIPQTLQKRRRQALLRWTLRRILLAINLLLHCLPIGAFGTHIPLHVGDVVEFGDIAILLHVWAFVFGHGGEQVFDDFVWDEGVAEVELCYVWLFSN
jgi:hypothetical protein